MGTDILYISHLMSIAALVPEDGADQEVAIASLLHDVAEDQGSEDMLPLRGVLPPQQIRDVPAYVAWASRRPAGKR